MYKTLFASVPVPAHPGCACMNMHESYTGMPATPMPGGPCGPWSPESPLEPCSLGHQCIISVIFYFGKINSKYLSFNNSSKSNCTFGPSGPTGPVNPAAPGGPWTAIYRLDRNFIYCVVLQRWDFKRQLGKLTTGPARPLGPSSPWDINKREGKREKRFGGLTGERVNRDLGWRSEPRLHRDYEKGMGIDSDSSYHEGMVMVRG